MFRSLVERRSAPVLLSALATLFGVAIGSAQSSSSLPALADLKRVEYAPAPRPDLVGVPSYDELRRVIHSFQSYRAGLKVVSRYEEPPRVRGPQGVYVFRKVSPAVVLIVVGTVVGDEVTDLAIGTGAIVDPAGYVMTNAHVVEGFREAVIFLKPRTGTGLRGNGYSARVVARDPVSDLALLKVVDPPAILPSLTVGDLTAAQIGQDIHIVGHPSGGNLWSYSAGVISQIRENYEWQYSDGSRHRATALQLQTAVNPGNSGGPVVDDAGTVVGLVFGSAEGQNLNYAIAAPVVKRFLSTSLQLRTRGVSGDRDTSSSPPAEYSVGQLVDGQQVMRIRHPDMAVYLVRRQNSQLVGLVAEGDDGTVLQAWDPGSTGGFTQWLATLPDGSTVTATGRAGLPETFVSR